MKTENRELGSFNWGAKPCIALYVKTSTLNSTRCSTGSQCYWKISGVAWSDFLDMVTSLAMQNSKHIADAVITWDQAQFSFRFVITFRGARRNENRAWYKPSTKRLPPTFWIDWHLPNQPTKITSVACFSSIQIFHAWEKCRLADLKSNFVC